MTFSTQIPWPLLLGALLLALAPVAAFLAAAAVLRALRCEGVAPGAGPRGRLGASGNGGNTGTNSAVFISFL